MSYGIHVMNETNKACTANQNKTFTNANHFHPLYFIYISTFDVRPLKWVTSVVLPFIENNNEVKPQQES